MLKRIIPILLLKNDELVKSIAFNNHSYIGDIINAVKIFNELEADELFIMDTSASDNGINYSLLEEISSECFMPLSYAGNIDSIEKIEKLIHLGVEKICINSASIDYEFLQKAVRQFGSSTISICVDYKYVNNKAIVHFSNGKIESDLTVMDHLININKLNVGEIIIQNIIRDGTYSEYDYVLLKEVSDKFQNPIVIAGGCHDQHSIKQGFDNGAAACAAGSLFVYYTNKKGILINYPDSSELNEIGIFR